MAESNKPADSAQQPPQKQAAQKSVSAASQTDTKLAENIEIATKLPLPATNSFWVIEADTLTGSGKKGLLGFLKKKDLTEEEIAVLRQEVEKAPGQARVKIQMLMKKHSATPSLLSLSAFCTYRMVQNSSNRKNALNGIKNAAKEAATALLNDGISLYNVENFLTIYFDYLGKLKRFQISTYKSVRETGRHLASKKNLATAIKLCDSMLEDKNRAVKVLIQIKGKFKSSSYTAVWRFADIQMAAKKVEQNDFKAMCGPAEAREIIVYILAITEIFSRIPFLSPLVDKILAFIPETTTSFSLRKSAIQVTRAFSQLNVDLQEGDMERVRTIGRQIFKTTSENMNKISDQPIKQSFEADPYFQLSRMAVLTFGMYESKEQKAILDKSLSAMKKVVKIDMTKNNVYTATAQNMVGKLMNLMSDKPDKSA